MKVEYYCEYSHNLGRNMEFKTYGHAGRPFLVFPSQNGRFFDYENNGMIAAVSAYIESGRAQMFCCDSNDLNSWSNTGWDNRWKLLQQEAYVRYIVAELCPRIFDINAAANGGNYADGIMTTGCSMGATHALNFLLRFPDSFAGTIALSGAYDARLFFPDYFDDLVYANSPVDYLQGMAYDHPFVEKYRHRQIIICTGQGAWEVPMQDDARRMSELFQHKNIDAWVDFWGTDVCHDWPWWRAEMAYFMNYAC